MTDNLPPLLNTDRIKFLKKIESKKCAFDVLTELLTSGQSEVTKNDVFDVLIAREKLGNTTIGNGIAIPRAHLDITYPKAALLVLKKGIDLKSADKINVRIFLAVLIPNNILDEYSTFISTIISKMTTEERYAKHTLDDKINAKNPEQLIKFFESLFIDDIENEEA